MTGKHRAAGERTKRLAVVGAATATVTALTVGAAAPQPVQARPELRLVHDQPLDLTASTSLFPKPGELPDITGGLGNTVYNEAQDLYATIAKALVGRVSVPALTGGLHINIGDVLNQIPVDLLDQVLGAVKIDLGSLLDGALPPGVSDALVGVLDLLNITDSAGNVSLSALLGLIGLDVSNIVDLANTDVAGVKIITPGPTFGLLKMLGLDIGWTPGTPNAVAEAINSTPYLDISGDGLLDIVFKQAKEALDVLGPLGVPLQLAVNLLHAVTDALPLELLDVTDVRIPIVAGIGLGAFSTGASYSKILSELGFQPGGSKASQHPLVGGFTILPMVLLNNLGRANGGLLSRFYPLGDLLGIDLLTPETGAVHSGGIPLLNTGLAVGGANLVPIKIDATAQYQPFSDFAAWPNPFSLANNLMAGTVGATYILRGLTLDTILEQVGDEVGDAVGNVTAGNPLALNIYLTLPAKTLPLLEPLYLTGDVLNAVSFGTMGTLPIRLANALAPALTSLVNLGYTDVVRNADGTYTRTLTDADTPTPFMTFPHVNPGQAVNDVIKSLVKGFQKEFFSGHPTAAPPNIVNELVKVVKSITSGSFAKELTKTATDAASGLAEANALPSAAARTLTLATGQTAESTGKHAAADDDTKADDTKADSKKDDSKKADSKKDDSKKDDAKKDDTKKDDTAKNEKPAQANPKPTVKKPDPLTKAVRDITRAFSPKKKPAASESKDSGTAKKSSEGARSGSAGEAA
ncbi:PE-PPE domain-containing protein [Mycolicibacterium fluoranthenivorans]|uniref:PE-PPE domain-containing protein n=1 Tax=Mycolicibacterium fluoranthenivorans TaxID=258505 RepID=A0A7G8PH68_9MYCO|nr:PE-PPE domain-containing protein [Mycolicibacterium fluoranthenivorans]QNJ93684.1 PE-PPE domain-containing protein [Mycolicibacterium fluoranthenivorans]